MFGHELCPHSYRHIDGVCSSVFIVQKVCNLLVAFILLVRTELAKYSSSWRPATDKTSALYTALIKLSATVSIYKELMTA